jgi:hypothetical protein
MSDELSTFFYYLLPIFYTILHVILSRLSVVPFPYALVTGSFPFFYLFQITFILYSYSVCTLNSSKSLIVGCSLVPS